MIKRFNTIVLSLAFILCLISSSGGFDNNPNKLNPNDPNDPRQRDYTRENSIKPKDQGGYSGGHDTITAEGMLLKEQVHQQTDPDGGVDFRNKMVREALPSLRTGAHDEDTYRYPLTDKYYANDRPIGSNKDVDGDFFTHFLDPSKVYKTTLCTTDGCKEGYYDQGA